MSVESFDPTSAPAITMTAAAIDHARRQIQQAGAQGIRLAVKESGCSGYMYIVDFVAEADDTDVSFPMADDVTLFVQKEALPIVRGTEIDFAKDGVNRVIKFRNPNVTAECGCGESFVVEAEQ
ncbi:HesB/IscA family protein [Saccharospirillum salsuginis]|uniref:Fe-S cluster assembly scaffold SufA n=1 Tax=Saccharospirillum salsuginis TaxID=418750 RepID=A0A918JYL8_9GAMM|nr:iron-sulfur cluster assembly accessory protein [Saccharospirillum salsuginis]GGX38498.1 Fe-S cluster assembly scaffold SufA [Saccharospirillum salsuginis]